MHYKRQTRTGVVGDSSFLEKFPNSGSCAVGVCERPAITKNLCEGHYQRLRSGGDLTTPIGRKVSPGTGGRWVTKRGYVMLTLAGVERKRISEHCYVMEQMLERGLLPGENVHHKNGIRHDNRPENLELWIVQQPAGQRAEDALAWAREIVKRYG